MNSNNYEKFPPTKAGIKMAMAFTPLDGWWEERVDWSKEKEEVFGEFDELLVLRALKLSLQEKQEFFSSADVVHINDALREYGIGAVALSGISYSGTEADVVAVNRKASLTPHAFSREALPA